MSQDKVIKALCGVMSEIGAITKSRKNPQQGYNFRGIDDIYNALQPALIKNGVVVIPTFDSIVREERQTKAGGNLIYTTVKGMFTFWCGDSFVQAVAYGEGMDSSDKSTNKAMSAAFKYALLQTLCIPTEEHIDSETETPRPEPKKPESKPEPKPQHDDDATPAQKKKLFAIAAQRFGDREKGLAFIRWALEQTGKEYWTKEIISSFFDEFESQAAAYDAEKAQAQNQMSLANTAYFANGFAVGGMMDRCWNCGDYVDENGKGCLCDRMKSELIELRRRNAELERVNKELSMSFDRTIDREDKLINRNAELEAEIERLEKYIDALHKQG